MASLLTSGKFHGFTNAGAPLAAGLLYTYAAGTTTPLATYTTQAGNVENANPVVLDSSGRASVWLGTSSYRLILKTSTGTTIWDVDNVSSPATAGDLSASSGASLIGFIQSGTGAVATTVQVKARQAFSVFDFMTSAQIADVQAGSLGVDVTAPINAATAAAFALSLGTIALPYDNIRKGGTTVHFPPGAYKTTGQINLYDGVVLKGAGRFSTVISSSYDGPIIRNVLTNYDAFGMGVQDMHIQGDRTKTSQDGIALLREWQGHYSNVSIRGCGRYGLYLLQCIGGTFTDMEVLECVGHNVYLRDGQNSWADTTANNLPTNTIVFNNIHSYGSDGAGIYFGQAGTGAIGSVNGVSFLGGSAEYNYKSSQGGGNTGYSIEVRANSTVPCEFINFWIEGGCQAHIYLNKANTDVRFHNLHHFGNGASGNVDRAAIVVAGTLHLYNPFGHGDAYKTISGSKAPFRLTKATASMRVLNAQGSTITDGKFVEDETYAATALYSNLRMANFGSDYGLRQLTTPSSDVGDEWYTEGEANPWLRTVGAKQLQFGSGSATPDAAIERKAANVLGMATGDSFQVGGTSGETLKYNAGTANASVATTMGSVGPTGSTAGNPLGWLRVNVAGTDRFVPYW